MVQPRVIMKVIRTCEECPHGNYNSGGMWFCRAAERDFSGNEANKKVQPFCPLDKAPASIT